jgi:hypothetical protein
MPRNSRKKRIGVAHESAHSGAQKFGTQRRNKIGVWAREYGEYDGEFEV